MAEEEIKQVDINGRIYDLQDETARKDNVYSTQEIDTGKKWIDGKPIYRKAGIYNNGGSTGTQRILLDATLTTSYVDTLIATGGSAVYPEDDNAKIAIGGYSGDTYRLCLCVLNVGLAKQNSASNYTNFCWWVEYTKK